ncbi:hypothetical protein GDO78_018729 [Eleutherodactylus coqui]|nr:hypothetical protein GDO78_018729 [Eleutherodactylus coqui]
MTACLLPMDEGPCKAMLPQYYYDRYTQTCQEFLYGGCGGNDNNFETLEDCEKTCWKIKNAPSFCYSPKDEGSCSASVPRFYFNIESKACEEFTYTGCGGNSNNFVRIEDCNKVCKKGNKKPRNRNRIRKMKTQS